MPKSPLQSERNANESIVIENIKKKDNLKHVGNSTLFPAQNGFPEGDFFFF